MEKKQIEKIDLVNEIDRLFYDIENKLTTKQGQ